MSASTPADFTASANLQLGDLFEERYRIEELIGSGGFADVYRATQLDIERTVAIKLLMPRIADAEAGEPYPEKLVERFLREAKLLSMLRDPHTITLYDFGRSNNGLLHMIFEFIDGDSLKTVIREEAPVDPARVVTILGQALQSLEEAHTVGVLHRDIKPGNIMVYGHLGREDRVKVLDFGIAKTVRDEVDLSRADLTSEGALIGTPRYMAPEQLRGHELKPASDIYSLGLVCYEMLTGSRAIESGETMQIISAQLDSVSFRLPTERPIPAALRQIVDRMLLKDTDRRYSSAAEILYDISKIMPMSGEFATAADVREVKRVLADGRDEAAESQTFIPDDDHRAQTPRRGTTASTEIRGGSPLHFASETERSARAGGEPERETGDGAVPSTPSGWSEQTAPTWLVGAIVVLALFIAGSLAYWLVSETPASTAAQTGDSASATGESHEEEGAAPKTMVIRSKPGSATARINGVVYGPTPVRVDPSTIEFPARIEVADGARVLVSEKVARPLEEFVLEMEYDPAHARRASSEGARRAQGVDEVTRGLASTVAELAENAETETARTRKRRPPRSRPRKRTRDTTRTEPETPRPEPREESGDSEEPRKGVSIPKLDDF